jgi:ankyrin repeat protein
MRGSLPMIELMLRNGADAAQTTKEGDSPIELALRFGHAEVADALKHARRAAAPAAEATTATVG